MMMGKHIALEAPHTPQRKRTSGGILRSLDSERNILLGNNYTYKSKVVQEGSVEGDQNKENRQVTPKRHLKLDRAKRSTEQRKAKLAMIRSPARPVFKLIATTKSPRKYDQPGQPESNCLLSKLADLACQSSEELNTRSTRCKTKPILHPPFRLSKHKTESNFLVKLKHRHEVMQLDPLLELTMQVSQLIDRPELVDSRRSRRPLVQFTFG